MTTPTSSASLKSSCSEAFNIANSRSANERLYHSPSAVGFSIVTVIAPAFVACVLLLLSAAPLSAAEPRVERTRATSDLRNEVERERREE
jgi:hypothetical protein